MCEWGRDSLESWGRKKRSVKTLSDEEKEEDMTLSQEILVLDFGDEKQSEYLKNDLSSAEFGKGNILLMIKNALNILSFRIILFYNI